MTPEEHILCEIEEFKIELQRSKDRTVRLEGFIKEKQTELYYARLDSPDKTLFRRLDIEGYMTDNCNRICKIVKLWLHPELNESGGEYTNGYTDGWNDYREELLKNLK